jgi:hypothetical protein
VVRNGAGIQSEAVWFQCTYSSTLIYTEEMHKDNFFEQLGCEGEERGMFSL